MRLGFGFGFGLGLGFRVRVSVGVRVSVVGDAPDRACGISDAIVAGEARGELKEAGEALQAVVAPGWGWG